ncbi:hypothetical protein [Mesobacillus selenatarsenatis]|uniref:TPR/glycosyl transferase domain protein n=1 Tax=Mesobacillus selenatarsenatis (strain DSM 18680 / JCM 14380 / FERM P-15431 / SF-1) TaxID=1321606 RepID=A0A0A8XB25_MESS1|nr:hypothetical protein [Mesobacillus selenatarsenatis]GAM16237.1 TPR/glycosyl transferase domain protein [Mesobacillus selenatarsenatis SF-1]
MKILYITSTLTREANSASIRNISLINGLVKNGAEVDALTIDWPMDIIDDYLESIISKKVNIYRDKLFILDKYFNNKLKKGMYVEHNENVRKKIYKLVKSIIRDILFFPEVDKEWIKNYNEQLNFKDYDYIISSSDSKTAHFVAMKIKKKFNTVKWVQIWGDPWAEDIGIKGLSKLRAKNAEKRLLKLADKIFYVSLPTLRRMEKENINYSSKMGYIPRGYLQKVNSEKQISSDCYVMSYTGVISYGRNIMNLLKAIKAFNSKSVRKFQLEIYGVCDDETKKQLKQYEDFVNWNQPVSYKKIIDVYKNSDVLLFLSNKKGAHQIPGKLYDYFGTNRSILAVVDDLKDNVSKFIHDTGRTVIVRNDENEILSKLNLLESEILEGNKKALVDYSDECIARELLNSI